MAAAPPSRRSSSPKVENRDDNDNDESPRHSLRFDVPSSLRSAAPTFRVTRQPSSIASSQHRFRMTIGSRGTGLSPETFFEASDEQEEDEEVEDDESSGVSVESAVLARIHRPPWPITTFIAKHAALTFGEGNDVRARAITNSSAAILLKKTQCWTVKTWSRLKNTCKKS